jgi:hypothetical protein
MLPSSPRLAPAILAPLGPSGTTAPPSTEILFTVPERKNPTHCPSGELRKIVALDEFHHEGRNADALFEPVDARDVGMVQRSEGLGFTREARLCGRDYSW